MHRLLRICLVVAVAMLVTSAALGQSAGSAASTRVGSRVPQGRRLLDEAMRERGTQRGSDPVIEKETADRPATVANAEFPPSDPFEFEKPPSGASSTPTSHTAPARQQRPGVAAAAYHEPINPESSSSEPAVATTKLDTRAPGGAPVEQAGQGTAPETLAPDLLPPQPLDPSAPAGNQQVDATTDTSIKSGTTLTGATAPADSAQALELAPRGDPRTEPSNGTADVAPEEAQHPSGSPLMTMLGSLALVLALFFAVVWIMRRAMPASSRPLPLDVIEVLGRTPLPGKQQPLQLVRLGNKLLLLATSTSGVQPLAEVTDPDEVDRLVRLCRGERYESPVTPFGDTLEEMARKRSHRRLDDEPVETAASALARRLGRSPRLEGSDV